MPFVSVETDVERVAQHKGDLSLVAEARAMRSPSSGSTASVTTEVGIGSPSFDFSWSNLVPAVSTATLLTTVRVIGSSVCSCGP